MLGIALLDGKLAGFVSWRTVRAGGPDGGCLEIGAMVFPEHRGQGRGTGGERRRVDFVFSTRASRLQAVTDVENVGEQRALERAGFRREGTMRGLAFLGGRWRDCVL